MPENKNKKKIKKTKSPKKPRAITLAIAEPRLRASRNPRRGALEVAERQTPRKASASAPLLQKAGGQIYEMMLNCSPWSAMLRHQALLAYAFSNMIDAQQQFAQIWRLPAR